jgi:hypothetical protein
LSGSVKEERISGYQRRIGARLEQFRESGLNIATPTGFQDCDIAPEAASGGLKVIHSAFDARKAGIQ